MTNNAANRVATYVALSVLLSIGYLAFYWQPWTGDGQSHTLMEISASIIALMVGLIAMVRFYAANDKILLFVGVGFIGAAFLDVYHFMVTSTFFTSNFLTDPFSAIPWSWIASRIYLPTILSIGFIAYRPKSDTEGSDRINEKQVFRIAGLLALTCFLFFAYIPLPRVYYPEFPLNRPEELIPAIIFGIALIRLLRRRNWEEDKFEHWHVISLLISIIVQTILCLHLSSCLIRSSNSRTCSKSLAIRLF